MDSIINPFICELASFFPERRKPKVGRSPIPVKTILYELFKLYKFNYGWRNIKHKTVCYEYQKEIQRRGLFNKFFNYLTRDLSKNRPSETIIDSSDWVSYQVKPEVRYSGKYYNYCLKITVEVNKEFVPLTWSLDAGSASDSNILEKVLQRQRKLPYEMYLDKVLRSFMGG